MMNQDEKDNNESEEKAAAPDPPEATAEVSEDMQVEPAPPTAVEEQPDPNNNNETAKGEEEEQEEGQPEKDAEEIKKEAETAVKAEEPSSPAPASAESAMDANISLPTAATPSTPSAAPPAPSTPPTAAPAASAPDGSAPSTETAALPSTNESATSTSPTPASPTAAAAPLVNDPDYIETPTDRDILSGRGKFVNYHPGNVVFRQLVLKHKVAYVSCPKPQKSGFAEQIVAELAERGARFLKQRAANSNGTGGGWYEIDKKAALLKTRQALREGAPELSEQLTGKSRYEQVTGMPPGGAAPAAPTAPPGLLNPMMPLGAGGSVVPGASAMAAAAGQANPGGKAGGGLRPDASPNPGGEGAKSPVLGATLPPGAVPPLHYPPALHTLPHPPMAAAAAAALGQTSPFGLMPPGLMYPGAAAAMPNPYADPAMAAMMMQNAAAMQGMMAGSAANPGAMMPMPGMMYPPGAGMMPNAAAAMAAGPYSALMAQQQAQQQQLGQLPQPMNLPTPGGDTGTTASGDGSAVAKDPTAPEPLPNTMVQPTQQPPPPQDNPDPAAMGGDAGASSAGLTEDGGTLTV